VKPHLKLEFTKSEYRALRDLVPDVADAEARIELASLDQDFQRWRDRQIDSQSLIEAIHVFHQHGARQLYSLYGALDAAEAVARGVALGFIDEARLASELRAKLERRITAYRAMREDAGDPAVEDPDED
jgi:hypothetical protein